MQFVNEFILNNYNYKVLIKLPLLISYGYSFLNVFVSILLYDFVMRAGIVQFIYRCKP